MDCLRIASAKRCEYLALSIVNKHSAYYPACRSPLGSRETYVQTLLTIGGLLIVAVAIVIIVLPVSLALAG